jgi:hypothetical protein
MTAAGFIHCRVTSETKAALRAAAERKHLTASALVKRMLELMLHMPVTDVTDARIGLARRSRLARLYVRLTPADWAFSKEKR